VCIEDSDSEAADTEMDQVTGQPPPPLWHCHWLHPSDLIDRTSKLSRAQRKLNGASHWHRFGLPVIRRPAGRRNMQIFTSNLQCLGEQYSASATRQSPAIYFSTDDMASTRDWKAAPAALDLNSIFGFLS
jgi:hypothetical protein